MPFVINGHPLETYPNEHNWVVPPSYGTSGLGRPLYPGVFAYSLQWPELSQAEFNMLADSYLSGTVTVQIPEWKGLATLGAVYDFREYSGTYLGEPEYQTYFEGYYQGVKLLINNVTV